MSMVRILPLHGVGISEWITVLDTKITPLSSRTARPEADLEDPLSKAASNKTVTLVLLAVYS
ncbi:hypothetical protein E1A91_A05G377500v1 [Gossypium mustelinum]|uniref:Uncharacterized protein n=1 Tax=Gossypium mustelinum TaxID=34275 RepID=A0A5D2ZGQ2_GOSMU|nr:hypothetical protein E1A91_A05G377500v1 [Gossypium mustelinum]